MNNIKYLIFAFTLSLLTAQNKSVIAVADVSADGLSSFEIKQVFNRLESDLVNLGQYNVTSRSEVDKILKEQKFQKSGCTDQECAADIGRMLNADFMLLSNILYDTRSGDINVTLKLVDVETARITTSISRDETVTRVRDINNFLYDYLVELYRKDSGEQPRDIYQPQKDVVGFGTLIIESSPIGATVLLDNAQKGVTPLTVESIEAGQHSIILSYTGYERLNKAVMIKADETTTVTELLIKRTGHLEIVSSPTGSDIYINDAYKGKTPLKLQFAITEFNASGVDQITARNISDRFSYELSKANKFEIVEREMMDKILEEQKFQKSGCVADACAVEIGQMIGVSLIVAGSVSKIEDLYSLNIRLIDVETGKIRYQDMDDYEGSTKDFIQITIKNMALRMAAEASQGMAQSGETKTQYTSTKKGDIVFNINKENVAIFIDGRYSSRSSGKQVLLSIAEGLHTIKFSLSGFEDWEKEINVLADEKLTYDVTLRSGRSKEIIADTGILLVRSNPSDAAVFVDGVEKGATLLQITDIGVGEHEIRVEKNFYHAYTEIVNVQADVISEVQGELKPNFGSLTIKSTPADAVVTIDGQLKGKTPYSIDRSKSGTYTIQVSKDLYHTHEENFIITDGSVNTRDIQLTPAFGKLIISTTPTNATVKLDGQAKGNTPLELDELPSGNYHLTVSKDLFQTIEQDVEIEDGITNKITVTLEARSGLLTIDGSPKNADIFSNGKTIGKIPLKNYRIAEGMVELTVRAKDYHEQKEFLTIGRNEIINKSFTLKQHTGKLIIITEPPDAEVYLDEKPMGKTPSILNNICVGKHSIRVKHPDYLEQSKSFTLTLDKKKEFRFKLITYAGSIQQKMDKAESRYKRYLGGATAMAALGIGAYFLGEKNYESYLNARSTSDATAYYNKTMVMDYGSVGSLIAAGALGLTSLKFYNEMWKLANTLRSASGKDAKFKANNEKIPIPTIDDDALGGKDAKFKVYADVKPPPGMVYVAGGTFQMGSNKESDEKPIHTVTVSSFYMDKTEVTQAQYKKVMGKNPSKFSGCDDCPVEQVSWHDANEYAKRVGKRLPTEAEWEYAARGGSAGSPTKYAGSNNIKDVAWYRGNSGNITHPVAQKQPNELGLYDMSGNVWEWCSDWYDDNYYKNSPKNNPKGPNSGTGRVLRGGYWGSVVTNCRVAARLRLVPGGRNGYYGFRLVSQDSP